MRKDLRAQALKIDETLAKEQDKDVLEISRLARRIERGEFKSPSHDKILA